MIFVTVGSQKFPFNRLLMKIDQLVEDGDIAEPVFAQIGVSEYLPKHYPYQPFMNQTGFEALLSKSDVVLTHGGTGIIFEALQRGKKIIAVPRMAEYGEHVDNHQFQIVTRLDEMNYICPCMSPDNLAAALETVRSRTYRPFQSNTGAVAASIREFLSRV